MTLEEIKENVTMRDVMDKYKIKVSRSNMCCCPIHKEKHPSMKIYKDSFNCFSCGAHGDIFSFVQEMEKCDFKTAFMFLGGTYDKDKNQLILLVKVHLLPPLNGYLVILFSQSARSAKVKYHLKEFSV